MAMSPEMREQALASMSPEDRAVALQAMEAERHGLDRDAKLSMACRIVKVVFTGLIKGEVAMRVAHWRLRQPVASRGRNHRFSRSKALSCSRPHRNC